MRNVIMFSLAGTWMCYTCVTSDSALLMMLFANVTLACFGVAAAFGFKKPGIFMKSSNGRVHLLSYLLLWPYFVANHGVLGLYRLFNRENPLDEVLPGLYLGCKLWSRDHRLLTERKVGAVVDITAEWSEANYILKTCAYLNVPVLDTYPPTPAQLHRAVTWIDKELPQQGVFVHCAAGHGRSATLVAAYLLYSGTVADVQEAIAFIKTKRPGININREQVGVLYHYYQELKCIQQDSETLTTRQ